MNITQNVTQEMLDYVGLCDPRYQVVFFDREKAATVYHSDKGWILDGDPNDPDYAPEGFSHFDYNLSKHRVLECQINEIYVLPSILAYGDYDNSCDVERSNHRVFLSEFGEIEGVHALCGFYDSHSVAIRIDLFCEHEEIKECFESLEDYPVIDEDDLSEMGIELQIEAWECWAEGDFLSALTSEIGAEDINILNSDKYYQYFIDLCEKNNEYWEYEASGAYIRIENVVKGATLEDVQKFATVDIDEEYYEWIDNYNELFDLVFNHPHRASVDVWAWAKKTNINKLFNTAKY